MADGLAKGLHPEQIAEDMFFSIDGLSQKKSNGDCPTEIIHAHAEDSWMVMKLGVQDVGADVEGVRRETPGFVLSALKWRGK